MTHNIVHGDAWCRINARQPVFELSEAYDEIHHPRQGASEEKLANAEELAQKDGPFRGGQQPWLRLWRTRIEPRRSGDGTKSYYKKFEA